MHRQRAPSFLPALVGEEKRWIKRQIDILRCRCALLVDLVHWGNKGNQRRKEQWWRKWWERWNEEELLTRKSFLQYLTMCSVFLNLYTYPVKSWGGSWASPWVSSPWILGRVHPGKTDRQWFTHCSTSHLWAMCMSLDCRWKLKYLEEHRHGETMQTLYMTTINGTPTVHIFINCPSSNTHQLNACTVESCIYLC